MKRKLIILSALAIFVAICAAGTLAYFTAETTAHNVITTGGVEIELNEWANEDKTEPFENLDGVMPGRTVTKIAEVRNTGKSAAWVRVKIEKNITLADGKFGEIDLSLVILDGLADEDSNWVLGEDGFYYYKNQLQPGETTEPIFKSVKFAPEMGNTYQGATATVNVTAYAVQVANNGKSVFEAKGWPADASGEITNP